MLTGEETRDFCYNCFQEKPAGAETCPHCGFNLEENEKKFPVALRAGTVLNNRYLIGRVLGQGGFGITYLAWDQKLQAKVAVKEFMPNEIVTRVGTTVSVAVESRTEDFTYGAERFQEEARILAKFMGQPGIAGVTDYFDENDTSYFVMDYIEGISFKTYIANQGGKVSADEALNVMIPVLRALTAVHAEGFIHRDVTPDNIYITRDGNVKLLDFGSARYSLGDKSKSLDVILKVGYAPKEQYIRRGRQGPYTDVYSCAACLYAAITGYLPPESLERLDQDTLVPPSQAGVEIPLYLERAMLKGLAVQPEDRFQSAAEFLEAIESQQVVEVPAAGTAAAPEKKKPAPLLLVGISVALIAAVGAGAFLGGRGAVSNPESKAAVETASTEAETPAPTVMIGGEEYSTDMTELNLEDKDLTNGDLIPLKEMTNLKALNLRDNPLTDISPLSELTHLEVLKLGSPDLEDLTPLAAMTGLKELEMENPKVKDLTPLAGLTDLKVLRLDRGNLRSSEITDLSPLGGLTGLEKLRLPPMPDYTDFSPLAGLSNLRELAMAGTKSAGTNHIDSLEFVRGMPLLEELDIVVQNVDLSPLAECSHMRRLSLLAETYYGDSLEIFSGMTELEELVLRKNTVEAQVSAMDLQHLSGLTKLQRIILTLNGLDSLSGIENLTALEEVELDLRNSALATLEPMASLSELENLEITFRENTGVPLDVAALAGLSKLQSVTIHPRGNSVIHESAVDHVPNVLID